MSRRGRAAAAGPQPARSPDGGADLRVGDSRAKDSRAKDSRAKDLRAERAAALAQRGAAAGPAARVEPSLVCACGAERYGLPLSAVAQVLPMRPCTPVPGSAPWLLGLIALSGRIVGVVGLARALGRPEAGPDGQDRTGQDRGGHLVVLRGARPALAVDRVLGIAHAAVAVGPGADADLGNGAALGYAPAADGSPDFVALDLQHLLRRISA